AAEHVVGAVAFAERLAFSRARQPRFSVAAAAIGVAHAQLARRAATAGGLADEHARRARAAGTAAAAGAVSAANHPRLAGLAALGSDIEDLAVAERGAFAALVTVARAAIRVAATDVTELHAVGDLLRTAIIVAETRAAVAPLLTGVARGLAG